MIGRFPYKILSKYPHLRPEDARIWSDFIRSYPNFYESVDYDLKVGTPRNYPGKDDDVYKKDLEYLSRKRVDVIGYTHNEIHVIEVKPRASFEAIGQVIGYAELYGPYAPEGMLVSAVIVTDEEIPDIRDLCFRKGILYFLV